MNFYGPTEATVFSTVYEWDPRRETNKSHNGIVSIGKPLPGFECRIKDPARAGLQNQQNTGELLLLGPQVSPGYWSDPLLNRQKFMSEIQGNRELKWYRTGDLAYFDPDGDLFYVGRIDDQVQIEGFRVELGEIEFFAKEYTRLSQVCAVAYESEIDNLKIHLFLEGNPDDLRGLKEFLISKLPHYMVPSGITLLKEIPLNQNGKTDRIKLTKMLRKE
jgi:acyl-CoA synthetase (AMP-forming)/AMP-acid ligase II